MMFAARTNLAFDLKEEFILHTYRLCIYTSPKAPYVNFLTNMSVEKHLPKKTRSRGNLLYICRKG